MPHSLKVCPFVCGPPQGARPMGTGQGRYRISLRCLPAPGQSLVHTRNLQSICAKEGMRRKRRKRRQGDKIPVLKGFSEAAGKDGCSGAMGRCQ